MKVFVVSALLLTIFIMSETVNANDFDVPIPCLNDKDCKRFNFLPSNTVCRNGFCACHEKGVNKNCTLPRSMLASTKISGPIIGHSCKQSIDCRIDNGFCNTTVSQCLCKHRFVSNTDNNKCLPVVNSIGGTCEDNKQCLNLLPHTTCSQNQCVCIEGYHDAENVCIQSKGIGEKCENTEECAHVDHAVCNNNNICFCSPGTIISSDSKMCLPISREFTGPNCDNDEYCRQYLDRDAKCINKMCECPCCKHWSPKFSACLDSKRAGESCDDDDHCYQDDWSTLHEIMKCVNKTCTCQKGFIRDLDRCIPKIKSSAMIPKMSMGLLIVPLLIFGSKLEFYF